jgi:hypothetical protein
VRAFVDLFDAMLIDPENLWPENFRDGPRRFTEDDLIREDGPGWRRVAARLDKEDMQ